MNFIANAAHFFKTTSSPQYAANLDKAKEKVEDAKVKAKIILIASVALAILGLAAAASGGLGGLIVLAIALPVAFACYNANQFCSNILEVLDNPSQFQNFGGFSNTFNKKALAEQLKKDTFWVDTTIDEFVEKIEEESNVTDPY